jgi:NAD-dependent deacetylase
MPERETAEAFRRSAACDLFIVIGSSLVVYPAAQMPVEAKRAGAKLVIINRDATPCDKIADIVLNGPAGATMEAILKAVAGEKMA